ncbi:MULTISPECIES: NEL-type E3 ubiquitin ligase domain-containing protein [unclassified Pseudomonas]|uniref:NEL-type E3 ubiquitin ligase domain-containing protein n=1 Tax=unclassified Pseudomonas TaxID=196821 RepID=UPI002B2227A3|nr:MULTISPECIES: NEL-type E3 ubiquitin ligase domain-containing protein [unclassified Pseudomonas]MEB0046484.1 NEL-type E3 ubiquitin ligase domain-containing protein [Pseudomonas sp. Dout3]MEB0097910.1 NEL-type E3 ubiquitin ligase domain-containing protein [Pseudomonas sp. DC1.2]
MEGPLKDLQQDIGAFAKPLFSMLIRSNFNTDEDISQLTVKLYVADRLIFGIDTGATRLRESTLLDAALHNFESAETVEGYFSSGTGVYRKNFRNELTLIPGMTLKKIATLCRQIDIGQQYQTHIKNILVPADSSVRASLEQDSIASEKAAFKLESLVAYLKSDLGSYAYGKLQQVHDGLSNIVFHDRPLHRHRLSLMGFRLHGIVLFSALSDPSRIKQAIDELMPDGLKQWLEWSQRIPVVSDNAYEKFKLLQVFFANGPRGLSDALIRRDDIYQQSDLSGPLIAYIPDDPVHPIKEYASMVEFMKELISQLRQPDYQAFFSRFVAQQDKGIFFSRVKGRLSTMTWQQRAPLDMGPWWRETAVENPNAEPISNVLEGDLWRALYLDKRDQAIADARVIAVPTGDEDAKSRWKRLTSYLDIGWNVFNFGAMLVPGLGEVMLGLMVAQMAAELLEGVEEWSQGDRDEAAAHLTGVMINFAQLALMGTGHVLPSGAAVAVKPSPLIDSLKPVTLANGKPRLWKADLTPYEHQVVLPDAKPNRLGLYEHQRQQWLRAQNKNYRVLKDPITGQHRLEHPTRYDAYQPKVEHNSAGAWRVESERPLSWDAHQVTQRLNSMLDAQSPEILANFRRVSGFDENQLRRLHVEHEKPPALLMDSVSRFDHYVTVERLPAQIKMSGVPEDMVGFLPPLMVELPRWPESRAIEVFAADDQAGVSSMHGNAMAAEPMRIKISRSELIAGQLPSRVIESLNVGEIRELLGEQVGSDTSARVEALRNQLATQAKKQTARLFESLCQGREVPTEPGVRLLMDDFPTLPANVAQELVEHAEPADLLQLTDSKRVPLRLGQQARRVQERVRLNRAYEGLYWEALAGADTRRLELGTLAALPGWSPEVRLEIRELKFDGRLLSSVGPVDAPIRKVLINDDKGRYITRGSQDEHLHGADNFYAAVLHALPDAERTALGYHIYEGDQLKAAVHRSPLDREKLAPILLEKPVRQPAYDPMAARLLGGADGYRYVPDGPNTRYRLRNLYPAFTEVELDEVIERFYRSGSPYRVQLEALENEFDQLCNSLQQWRESPTVSFRWSPDGVNQIATRDRIITSLRQCWQRTGPRHIAPDGSYIGQTLNISDFRLGPHFETLPKLQANFDHVTRLLLRNAELSNTHQAFLQPFRKVRVLDLAFNKFRALPPIIAEMPHLTELNLSTNEIALTSADVQMLADRRQLLKLNLSGNPLGLLPDISRMPDLHTLNLSDTGVNTWPPGLFDLPRFRHFHLDLQRNVLTVIPSVARGSADAELLARTLLSRQPPWMSAQNLEILKEYIRSVGMDPERLYPPRGTQDSLAWETGFTRPQWVAKQAVWNAVEAESGSLEFFNEIRTLTHSYDFTHSSAYRTDLTAKVWRMLDAMSENTELRTTFFAEAKVRSQCVDGATQLFNVMGLKVLVHEAYALDNAGLIESELVNLAKGKSRLDEIERIAERHIAQRISAGETFRAVGANGDVTGSIDVVEVHLAFMTDLAERLDLPWQARGMQFRRIAGVTRQMIDDAYQRVLGLEEGDLLRDSIASQPFWETFVQRSNRARFKALRRKVEATYEFKEALDDRAASTERSPEERAHLKERIRVVAAELGRPESAYDVGLVVSDEEYAAQNQSIKEESKALLSQLTQAAMDRAKLQRVEVPFTVQTDS